LTRIPWLGIAVLGIAACAGPRILEPARPISPQEILPLLEDVRDEGARRNSLRGLAKVKLESPEASGSVREVILAERPGRLRLETLNLLGQTQAVLVTDGSGYAYYEGGTVERGVVGEGLLRRRLGLDLSPEEAVETLLVDPRFDLVQARGAVAVGEDRYVEAGLRRLRIGPEGEVRGLEALDEDGTVRWAVEYGRWQDVAGERYPFTVRLEFPATQVRAELLLREVELNADLDPSLFDLPRGASR
jgi:outer membrane biogenesis lipoprotein LolB